MRMSLPVFLKHKEFIDMRDSLQTEYIRKSEEERKRSQARGR